MKVLALALAAAGLLTTAAAAQQPTVSTLLADGWEVEAVFPSNAGPGIVLEKDDRLMMCFVAETPDSPSLKTQYCKPVE